jgi:DNA-directed RNA polymerase subunit RPC12/RpoP
MSGNMFGETLFVCSRCGRTADSRHVRGWLVGTHTDPERAVNGEMVIRCPEHVTDDAIRNTVNGRDAIRS